jgi:hypothetical protein
MNLTELDAEECLALVGLVKAVILSDGRVSEAETREVRKVVDALGSESYQRSLDAFDARFPDQKSFQSFLGTLVRPEARELIYGTILTGAASADTMDREESELLDWLAKLWNIETSVVE